MVKRLIKALFSGILFTFIFLNGLSNSAVFAAPDPFPIYKCLEPNVKFWKKVFTRYSSKQGIIHNSRHLSIIYDVIELQDVEKSGSWKINKKRIRKSKKKYKNILIKLGRGAPPSSPDERRVTDLFGPNATHKRFLKAKDNIRCQIGQRDRFREGLIRSGAFLDQIKAIFESYNLPSDLAYLPHVESSFDLNAYSKFGAAGMWQFIRSTGRRFLKIDYTLDERRDPIRSSHAAAQLMKTNYEMLGTWPMAITAYNHGVYGMLRAKRVKGSYQTIFKGYKSRLFKFASRNFYSEFLAARYVAKNYKKYFGDLKLHNPVGAHEILMKGYLPMKDLAHHFDIDVAEIRALNPSLRRPVYSGQKYIPKGHFLRLPLDAGKHKKSHLFEIPKYLYKPKQKRSLFHRVQKGDTAGKIAKVHGVELSELMLANNLDSRATIYIGQNLRLPWPDEKINRLLVAKAMEKDIRTLPNRRDRSPKQSNLTSQTLTSDKKDSSAFSEKLQADNLPINLDVVTGSLSIEKYVIRKGKPIGTIRVMAEETLGHYADWLEIATQKIRKLNGFRYGRVLRINELVKIPLENNSKEVFEEKRFEYHKEIVEDFIDAYKVENVEIYKIKDGDNMWKICNEIFEVPLWLIIKYNPSVNFSNLRPLHQILVPVVEKK